MCVCVCAWVCYQPYYCSATNTVRWHYSDVQYLCAPVRLSMGVYACICVCVCVCECASDHFPVIILCAFAMSNEALAVWRMLFNHANQHHAHSLQGYCSQCWTVSKADLLLADLFCPLPAAPANDTTALMERLTGKEGGTKKDKEGVGTRVKERKNGTE